MGKRILCRGESGKGRRVGRRRGDEGGKGGTIEEGEGREGKSGGCVGGRGGGEEAMAAWQAAREMCFWD